MRSRSRFDNRRSKAGRGTGHLRLASAFALACVAGPGCFRTAVWPVDIPVRIEDRALTTFDPGEGRLGAWIRTKVTTVILWPDDLFVPVESDEADVSFWRTDTGDRVVLSDAAGLELSLRDSWASTGFTSEHDPSRTARSRLCVQLRQLRSGETTIESSKGSFRVRNAFTGRFWDSTDCWPSERDRFSVLPAP